MRGQIAERYNVHGSMSIAYTEMGKWADKLERELEEANHALKVEREGHDLERRLMRATAEEVQCVLAKLTSQLTPHKAALEKCKSVLTSIRRGEYSGGIDEALTAINELKAPNDTKIPL